MKRTTTLALSIFVVIAVTVLVTVACILPRVFGTPEQVAQCFREKNALALSEARRLVPTGSTIVQTRERLSHATQLIDAEQCGQVDGRPEMRCPIASNCDPGLIGSELVFWFTDAGVLIDSDAVTFRGQARAE